jgi:hypothetical protein
MEIKQCNILMGKEKIHLIINVGVEAGLKLKKIETGTVIRIHDRLKKSKKHRPVYKKSVRINDNTLNHAAFARSGAVF